MVKKVEVYVEGGGEGKDMKIRCREGFHKLLDRSGLKNKPRIIRGGSRNATFKKFETAVKFPNDSYPVLLVDSEDILIKPDMDAWVHLQIRDGWKRPQTVVDKQAQLMVTCMETWIMADHKTLITFFGTPLNRKDLLPPQNLEVRNRHDVQNALENATRSCGNDMMYQKGKRSFKILGELNPDELRKYLPHFDSLVTTLSNLLDGTKN
jgi:hypothetical protein